MKLNGLVGGGTGKLGNSVFSQNAGRTIVRQYQSEVKNPNTARQQNSRARFTLAGDIAKMFAQALAIGRPRVGALTSRNQFTKDVIPVDAGVINFVGNALVPDYTKMPIAKGGMPKPTFVGAGVAAGSSEIEISFDGNYDPTAAGYIPPMNGTAGMVLAAVNVEKGECYLAQVSTLDSGHGNVVIPTAVAGQKFQCYIFAKWIPASRNDIDSLTEPWKYPSDQSDVVYCGEITVTE